MEKEEEVFEPLVALPVDGSGDEMTTAATFMSQQFTANVVQPEVRAACVV